MVEETVKDYRGLLTRQTAYARHPTRVARRPRALHADDAEGRPAVVRVQRTVLRRQDSPGSTGPKRWWPQRDASKTTDSKCAISLRVEQHYRRLPSAPKWSFPAHEDGLSRRASWPTS